MALSQQARAPIKHLRNLNPYAEAALGDWQRKSWVQGQLPRQCSADSSGSTHDQAAGTSSFGMSGVNAHLLLTAAASASGSRLGPAKVRLGGSCSEQGIMYRG